MTWSGLACKTKAWRYRIPKPLRGRNSDLAQYSNTPALRYSGVASILRTGVQIDFCPENTDFVPKGLQDSARGFNPGYG